MSFESNSPITARVFQLNWLLILLLVCVAGIGTMTLYSAGNGSFSPWAGNHMIRFFVLLAGACAISFIDMRFWYKMTYPIYAAGLVMLIIVEVMGMVGMGAQRWIDLGIIQLQPSELMKLAVIMALAKYFHGKSPEDIKHLSTLIIPAMLVVAPVGLVMTQPDLGTSLMIVMGAAIILFVAGAAWWLFAGGAIIVAAAIPVAYSFLHDYQKKRVDIFLDPEKDPFGAGYHITQSKIAIGSGGLSGKGFLNGSQGHLNYLPEKQTDFIFTLFVEEWGFFGGLVLLTLNAAIILYGIWISYNCRHTFGRLLAFGLTMNYALYVSINIAMVMGLIPVVGVPLPMFSHGGTAMMAALIGFGLIMGCSIHRDAKLPRSGF
ncbi:MAG: rod shape-determining protein RodA [Pseudobdellovibrionaceae bacterium]